MLIIITTVYGGSSVHYVPNFASEKLCFEAGQKIIQVALSRMHGFVCVEGIK